MAGKKPHLHKYSGKENQYVGVERQHRQISPCLNPLRHDPKYDLGAYAVICLSWPLTLDSHQSYLENNDEKRRYSGISMLLQPAGGGEDEWTDCGGFG